MKPRTIEGAIQEEILEALLNDYETSIELMAQLSANMLLSGPRTDIEAFFVRVRHHHTIYIEYETY